MSEVLRNILKTLKLEQYYDTLYDEGYATEDDLFVMEMEDLKDLEIKTPHKKRILNEIEKLKKLKNHRDEEKQEITYKSAEGNNVNKNEQVKQNENNITKSCSTPTTKEEHETKREESPKSEKIIFNRVDNNIVDNNNVDNKDINKNNNDNNKIDIKTTNPPKVKNHLIDKIKSSKSNEVEEERVKANTNPSISKIRNYAEIVGNSNNNNNANEIKPTITYLGDLKIETIPLKYNSS